MVDPARADHTLLDTEPVPTEERGFAGMKRKREKGREKTKKLT